MARVRMPDVCNLKSWDDVNLSLAEIGELQRSIEAVEAVMQQKIDDATLEADDVAAPYKKRIDYIAGQLKMFTESHVNDLGKKKTRLVTFGKVGYRKSTNVKLPEKREELDAVISALKAKGMKDCLVPQPDKIIKNKLKTYGADIVQSVGASLETDDTFWWEVDRKKLEDAK